MGTTAKPDDGTFTEESHGVTLAHSENNIMAKLYTHITYKLKQDVSVIIVLDSVWGIISVRETEVKPQQ